MKSTSVFISIVIPVYNEQHRIHSFLKSAIDYLGKKDFSYEIVVVDDGSRDETVPIVNAVLNEKLPGIYKIIKLSVNAGKGAAVRKGMLAAEGEYVFFLDADGSTAIEEIDRFIPHFTSGVAIYTARRTLKQEAPFKRKFFGYGYILLANFLLKLNVSDITCGFKCYTKGCIHTIFSRQRLNNWSFDAENIFTARKHDYQIKEIRVTWMHTPGSKVKVFKNVVVCGLDLLKIRLNDLRGLYS
jgi:dolichyl-phosphate beta-glucosyltransferase